MRGLLSRASSFDQRRKDDHPFKAGSSSSGIEYIAPTHEEPRRIDHKRTPSRTGSLASKLSRAFSSSRGPSRGISSSDISTPLGPTTEHMGTPGSGDFLHVKHVGRSPSLPEECNVSFESSSPRARASSCTPIMQPRSPSPLSRPPLRAMHSIPVARSRPTLFADARKQSSPHLSQRSHERHMSLPPSSSSPRGFGQAPSIQRLKNDQLEPFLAKSRSKLGPRPSTGTGTPPPPLHVVSRRNSLNAGSSSPVSANDSVSSARFRIKRKPPPSLTEDDSAQSSAMPSPMGDHDKPNSPLGLNFAANNVSKPSFQREIDRLFDELFEECGTTENTTAHRRTRSQPVTSSDSALRRTPAIRAESRRVIATDKHLHKKSHPPVAHTPAFVPSGRSFEPIRSKPRNVSIPSPPTPKTPTTPGRVRNAVLEIERAASATPTQSNCATPIKNLGAILDKSHSVDSNELTLESKRLMEETRRRRYGYAHARSRSEPFL